MRLFGVAIGGAIAAMAASEAPAVSIDFEGLRSGQGVIGDGTTATVADGVTVTLSGAKGQLGVYDTACRPNTSNPCTGGDIDLATGDGIAGLGRKNKPIENTPAEGFILINAKDFSNGFGDIKGDAIFTFNFVKPSVIDRFSLIDIDEVGSRVSATFGFADGSTRAISGSDASDVLNLGKNNSHSTFVMSVVAANLGLPSLLNPVSSFSIAFDNISGGIASIEAAPAAVPVPAAFSLLASALGVMGWIAFCRRARA